MADPAVDRVAGSDDEGRRLDQVLGGWTGRSRSWAQRLLDSGLVTVDGQQASKSDRLVAGQQVVATTPPRPDPGPAPVVPVRYEDDHLAVVAKPADLVVHQGAGVRGATLVDALLAQGMRLADGDDPARPGIVHRLDRGTSGLLVVAKSVPAMIALKSMFAVHEIERAYWAMVEGHPDPPAATIDAPIQRSTRNRTTFTTADGGRRAITHYQTVAAHPGLAELTVTLETGRTHQVRVHLRAIGRPVAGDLTYAASPQTAKRLGLTRPALHARQLGFVHPIRHTPVEVEEPLPQDLRTARRRAAQR